MAKTYNGGYVMLDLADPKLYDRAKAAIGSGKPVMLYDTDNAVYYIDSIALDGTNVVITKGGKTITIESDGDITESGNIQNHLYKHNIDFELLDGNGNSLGFLIGTLYSKKPALTKDDLKVRITYYFEGFVFNANSDNDNPIRIAKEMQYTEEYCYITMTDYNNGMDTTDIDFDLEESNFDVITEQIF